MADNQGDCGLFSINQTRLTLIFWDYLCSSCLFNLIWCHFSTDTWWSVGICIYFHQWKYDVGKLPKNSFFHWHHQDLVPSIEDSCEKYVFVDVFSRTISLAIISFLKSLTSICLHILVATLEMYILVVLKT